MSRNLIYILFTLGGVAGLIYEVVWTRSFSLVFGSTTRSAAVVLAAYFAGMALGNLLGGRLSQRPRPVRMYGLAEIVVGLTALLVLPWLSLFTHLYPSFYDALRSQPGLLTAIKLALAAVAIGPPVVAMGATLPLVARAMVSRTDHVAGRTGLLYALNTGGATLGVLLAGFLLPTSVGIRHSAHLAVAINLLIGVVAVRLGAGDVKGMVEPIAHEPEPVGRVRRPALSIIIIAAISGFGTLGLEVAYTRLLSHRTEMSVYSFALMLATFLVFLALGSLIVSRWLDRVRPWRFLAWTQLAGMLAVLLSPLIFRYLPTLAFFGPGRNLAIQIAKLGLLTMLSLGPAVLLMGVVLPTSWKLATHSVSVASRRVGSLTAVNTVAAVAGSLTMGFLLLPWLGIGGGILGIAALYGVVVVLATWRGWMGVGRWAGIAACVVLLAGWCLSGLWRLQPQSLKPGQTLIWYNEGEAGSVAVVERDDSHRIMFMNSSYVLGTSSAWFSEVRQGRLPLLLHERPQRVAFIGVATGLTVSAILDFPVQRVAAIEIVPGVADALAYFDDWNRSVFDDPRVELIVEDGRNYLLGTQEQFDVIIGDLFVPWHAGTGYLYTVEHFQTVARRLAPGGIFAQWLPGHQLRVEELRAICASFLDAFPAATLWRSNFGDKPLLALVGYRDGLRFNPAIAQVQCQQLAGTSRPMEQFISTPAGLGLLYVCGDRQLRGWARDAERNTDDRPFIEFSAPQSLYALRQRYVEPMQEFLAQWQPRQWPYPQALAPGDQTQRAMLAADLMSRAVAAKVAGHPEQEFPLLEQVIPLAGPVPGMAEYVYKAAQRYERQGRLERTEALLDALVQGGTYPIAAVVRLAEIRHQAGRTNLAIELLEWALQRAPGAHAVRASLAAILRETRRYAQAEVHLQRMLKARRADVMLRLDLAEVLHGQGKTAEARREVERVLRIADAERRQSIMEHLRERDLETYAEPASAAP